jgi:hypothetical protein
MLLLAMAEDAMAEDRLDPGFMDGEYKPFLAWSWEALVRPLAERGGWVELRKWRARNEKIALEHAERLYQTPLEWESMEAVDYMGRNYTTAKRCKTMRCKVRKGVGVLQEGIQSLQRKTSRKK